MIQISETAKFHEQTLAMTEALMLALVRQDELIEAADASNDRLQEQIGERIEAEEALLQAQVRLSDRAGQLEGLVAVRTAELNATNRQLEAFVYSIAHDLRAPLRSMQGFSELLVQDAATTLSSSGRGFANRINQSARFMDALLCDLLAFSRISQQSVELTSLNLGTIVDSMIARLECDTPENSALVEKMGDWPLVRAHEATVIQVLLNLVGNALKFVRTDVTPEVRLRSETRAGFVRVWVEDNGTGIAPDHQSQIFGLFTRLHGEKYQGTGIGLAIVQKGVERMGGQVGVESDLGQGSRFWFELRPA
jgi:signal transduction histidine kinase